MLTKIQTLASLYRQLGPRWLAFRFAYALRFRTGLIRWQMPSYPWTDRPLGTWLKKNIPSEPKNYAEWRKANAPKFFTSVGAWSSRPLYSENAIAEADRILNGEIKFFAHEFHHTGFPPNWHRDPVSGTTLDPNKHWSHLSDDGEVDIKFIWEPNRFAFIYTLVRAYAATNDEKYALAFWNLIHDWAEHNPPNRGANWKDGQEIALRLMAWTFGFYAFINSPSTTQQRISQFTLYVAAQTERIYKNIEYAVSTRSNHTVSEAFGLWMTGLLFPELKDAEKYFSLGLKLLEEESEKQIFPDGSYSMYSLNYHRFVLHLYLYAIKLGELNQQPFSTQLQRNISNSIDFLSNLIDPTTGQMPVYGSNDGALVLPLNNCGFNDYRPLLQLGSVITKGERMFVAGDWDEDVFWLCGDERVKKEEREKTVNDSFPDGGVYLLHGENSKAVMRCTDFKERPSHADQLHVDLWINGMNIACDAGTYLYSGEGVWRNGLAHTAAHNTVTVDAKNQMKLVSRFVWTDWSKGTVLQQSDRLWQGEHDGYKPVTHKRTVIALDGDRWLVIDHLGANQPHHYALHWLLSDAPFEEKKNSIHLQYESRKHKVQMGLLEGEEKFSIVRADSNSTRGWRSRYYGHKEPAISVTLETDQAHAVFWTFFGKDSDQVEVTGKVLKINSIVQLIIDD